MKQFKDTDMQLLLGRVLRAGTIISVSIVFIGGIIYLYRHGQSVADYSVWNGVPVFIQHAGSLVNGAFDFRGQAIIQIGIILLVATPIMRVIFSTIGFVLEKDYIYTGISILVLLIILASMISGHAV